jgi:photosystem II stability/assembly factor-like uncharacterized protein
MAAEARCAGAVLALLLCACPQQGWSVVGGKLDRPGLCVWSPAAGEAFVSGGGLGNGAPALLLHLKSRKWSPIDVGGTTSTLWWIHGFSASRQFVVGEQGTIFDVVDGTATAMTSGTKATLFGVWGSAADDVWAVGGSPGSVGANDVLLHYDGTQWSQVAVPEVLGATYFKVWGSAKNDVFVVGQGGIILHYDGAAWTRQASPVKTTLLTVDGRSSTDVYAVGGPPTTLLHYDGTAWSKVESIELASGLTGVSAAPDGTTRVVGLGGTKWKAAKTGAVFTSESQEQPRLDLHSVFTAADGSAWAVGGDFLVAGTPGVAKKGVIAYFGEDQIPALP